MASRIRRGLALGALLLAALPRPAEAVLRCPEVPGLMEAFVRNHVQWNTLDSPELEERTIDSWLRRADPSRSLLTRAEFDAQRRALRGLFARVRAGDCKPIFDVHNALVRQNERTLKFVRAYLSDPGYAVDEKATVVLDPEKRGNPTSADERDALLRNLVHLQMATYLSNGTPLPDAKKKLADRYDRRLRRLLETPDEEKLGEFLDSFAAALDPHSSYLSPQVLEDFRIGMSLSLEGIGVALSEEDGYAIAERIIPGGAADRLKALRPKDKIIAVAPNGDGDYRDIIDMPLREAVALIRGKAGSTVNLTVLREGETTERFNVAIVRDKIDLEEQAASLRMVEREVNGKKVKLALLDLPSFYGDSDPSQRQETKDVERLLRQAREQGADGLLLDLSRNGGGLLQHAVVTSGFFLKSGAVVAIENGSGARQVQSDTDPSTAWSGPLVVLVSRASASASEILAGALKDYRRALIVGDEHTFGKGTVQTVQPIGRDEGALKITTQLFFRPGGLSTQHDGVRSDVLVPSPLAGEDYGEKNQPYSIPPHTTQPFLSTKEVNDERSPASHWRPLDDALVSELARRSEARTEKDPAFVELRDQIAERAKRPPAVPIAEILEEREEQEKKAPPPDAPKEKEPPRPEVEEALNVLADLVVLAR